ncbi:MAG: lamin tail domain-containing protein [Chlamydiia bacterium]|nr:lamin tail domain-containing protein [Chlamydiia bacterium]
MRKTYTFLLMVFIITLSYGQNVGDVIITEIMQNPSKVGDTAGEWFELYNTTTVDVDINGWTLTDTNSDMIFESSTGTTIIPAGGYLVFCNNGDIATNGGINVDYDYSGKGIGLTNSDGKLILSNNSVDIDIVIWDNGVTFPDPNGKSMSLNPNKFDSVSNDDGTNWKEATSTYGDGDYGTPGSMNDNHSNVKIGDLIITEVMFNPNAVSDSNGEWFEIYNTTDADINLNGWRIEDDGTSTEGFTISMDLTIPSKGYLFFANNGDALDNGGLPTPDYIYNSSMTLGNGTDGLQIILNGVQVDLVIWDGGNLFPFPSGKSISLRTDKVNSDDNDFGYNWCSGTTAYGDGDMGTPGAVNDDCVACVNEGDVIISEIMRNPTTPESSREWIELYNTTDADINLKSWRVADDNVAGEGFSIKPADDADLILPAKGYLVLANNDDSSVNGGVTPDYVYDPSLTLGNGIDGLQLYCNANLVDAVIWDDGTIFPNTDGKSMSLMVDKLDHVSNDAGTSWEEVTFTFGDGGFGTPGAQNDQALSINKNKVSELSIYPNPVSFGSFVLTTSSMGTKEVSIYNVLGSQVFRQNFNSSKLEVNISNFDSGMYFVRVVEGKNISVNKLVIQ